MYFKLAAFGLASVTAFAAVVEDASAQRRDRDRDRDATWESLGCVDVGRRGDTEVIRVGRREGRFSAVRFEARGNDVRVDDVRVIYGNGRPDELRVRDVLREGRQTRAIELEGRERFIDSIELTVRRDFDSGRRGRAQLCAEGLQVEDRRPERLPIARGYEDLGCVDVSRRGDTEVIRVGRREGRFSAVRFEAVGNDVRVDDVKVIYGNGRPDELRVRDVLREGRQTRDIDLEGRARFIDRIELTVRRDFDSGRRGRAQVCAIGKEGRDEDRRGPPRRVAQWDQLGCVRTNLRADNDIVRVGRREGRFSKIRLRVQGGTVEIDSLRVVYGNGQPDDVTVRAKLRDGDVTRPLDLSGGDRFIAQIEMRTKRETRDAVRGILKGVLEGRGIEQAEICVDGLDEGPGRGERGERVDRGGRGVRDR